MGHAGQLIEKVQLLKRPGFFFVFLLALSSQISVALGSVASAAGILFLLFNAEARRQLRGKDTKIIFVGMTVFVLTCFLTNFFSADVVSSQKLLWAHVQRWIPFFLVVAFVRTKEEWWMVVGGLIFSTLIADAAGIYQAVHGMARPIGFERNPIYYANELVVMVLFCFGILINQILRDTSKWKSALISVSVLSCVTIALSMTRGAWVALAVGVIGFLLFKKSIWQKKSLRAIILVGIIISTSVFTFNANFHERISSIFVLNHGANVERFLIWHSACNMFLDHPLTGVGMGEFDRFYQSQYILPGVIEPYLVHPHNSLLNFLSENGLPGGVGFLSLFVAVLYFGLRFCEQGYLAALVTVSFLVGSITDHLFTVLMLMRVYWFVVGMIIVVQRLFCESKPCQRMRI